MAGGPPQSAPCAALRVDDLPAAPLDAAAAFHAQWLPRVRKAAGQGDLAIIFPLADHAHRAWRLSAVQELARESAPRRVNAIVSDDPAAIAETLHYLARAPGITGQIMVVGGNVPKMD